jgi:hypothetical protein
MSKKQTEDAEYIQVSPYEVEFTRSHVMPGTDTIKEDHFKISTPTLQATEKLLKRFWKGEE